MPQYIFAIAKGFRSTPLPINGSGEDQNPLASEDGRNIDNYAFLLNLAIGFFCMPSIVNYIFILIGKKIKNGTSIFSGNGTYNSTAWNATYVVNTTFTHNSTYSPIIHHSLITTPSEEYYK